MTGQLNGLVSGGLTVKNSSNEFCTILSSSPAKMYQSFLISYGVDFDGSIFSRAVVNS